MPLDSKHPAAAKKPKAAVVRLYIAETVRDCTMITTSDVNI